MRSAPFCLGPRFDPLVINGAPHKTDFKVPNLGLAVILLVGGRQVINGTLTLGDFTAFYTYLLMMIGPMRMLGVAMGMSQRAIASGNRMFEIIDREPAIQSPPGAPARDARSAASAAAPRNARRERE